MDAQAKVAEIRQIVADARSMPMSASAVINRGDDTIPPRGRTVVEAGDRLFVLVPREIRADLEDVFSRWRRRV